MHVKDELQMCKMCCVHCIVAMQHKHCCSVKYDMINF